MRPFAAALHHLAQPCDQSPSMRGRRTVTQRPPTLGVIADRYMPALGCHHEVCELAEFLFYMVAVGRPRADLEVKLGRGAASRAA
jgi:hypothetical protein